MSKGENIFKRKDGRWEARYIKGHDSSGKIKYGFCYGKTYKEAKDKAAKCKTAVAIGTPPPQRGCRKSFSVYCDEWLHSRRQYVKDSTYVKYDTILNRHIKPKLGSIYPFAFTTGLIESFSRELLCLEGFSPKTVKDILVVLASILKFAEKQHPGTFPIVEVVYPKDIRKEMRVLSREEQSRLVRYLLEDMDECKFGVLLALLTGMRIGEVCALKWEAVNLPEQTIHIGATLQRLQDPDRTGDAKTKLVVGLPKSGKSLRTVPLTGQAAELCLKMHPGDEDSYLLTGTRKCMEPRLLQRRLKKYVTECSLEGVHFHTLRHTFATRCVEVGFEIKSLSEILGHSTTAITLDRYVHSSMELKRSNMKKLETIGL